MTGYPETIRERSGIYASDYRRSVAFRHRVTANFARLVIPHSLGILTAFRDIQPQAPSHVLIIPNEHIPTAADVSEEHEATLGHMLVVAAKIARDEGIDENGYRLIINCKDDGHQEVNHLHMHLLGGRPLGRMLAAAR